MQRYESSWRQAHAVSHCLLQQQEYLRRMDAWHPHVNLKRLDKASGGKHSKNSHENYVKSHDACLQVTGPRTTHESLYLLVSCDRKRHILCIAYHTATGRAIGIASPVTGKSQECAWKQWQESETCCNALCHVNTSGGC